MNRKSPLAVAAALALAVAAGGPVAAKSPAEPAAAAAKPGGQCFWNHNVENFASNDNRIVNVRVGVKDVYRFEMFAPCQDVDWANHITIVARGSSHICTGMDAELIVPASGLGPQRCSVRNIRKLTPDEIKALPKHARP